MDRPSIIAMRSNYLRLFDLRADNEGPIGHRFLLQSEIESITK